MKFNLTESLQSYYIRYWYDRISKNWIVQVFDENNYEVESSYVGTLPDAKSEINWFKEKYHTNDARKFRKGE